MLVDAREEDDMRKSVIERELTKIAPLTGAIKAVKSNTVQSTGPDTMGRTTGIWKPRAAGAGSLRKAPALSRSICRKRAV
jgi:hypothetical protein